MKILFLSQYFAPEGNAPATRVAALCKVWHAAGHDISVLTCAPNVPTGRVYPGFRNRWHSESLESGIRVVRGWIYMAANRGFVRRTMCFCSYFAMALIRARRLPKADVVVATTPQLFCAWAGIWVARMMNARAIVEVRDLWPQSIVAVGALDLDKWWARNLYRLLETLESRLYEAADHIVTVGEGYCKHLVERGVAREKISIISNGVDTTRFKPRAPSPDVRAQAGAGDRDFLIGYIGTVGMAHGLDVVIRAARLARSRGHDELRFVVIGDGARRGQLERELELDDPGNLRFVGMRPKEEMPDWLTAVDACLVHLEPVALFESVVPTKMFEAAASGRPIILGVRGEAQRLLERLGAGFTIVPKNEEQLIELALQLARQPKQSADEAQRTWSKVKAEFDWSHLAQEYLKLLSRIVEGPSATRHDVQAPSDSKHDTRSRDSDFSKAA